MDKREFEVQGEEREKFTSKDVEKSLQSLSKKNWEDANWPLVTFVSREVVEKTDEGSRDSFSFWKEIFNPKHFIYPGVKNKNSYNFEKHSLYILHSFSEPGKKDVVFKAITTNPKKLLKDPEHWINYEFHGKPCEGDSKSSYPTCFDFWKDYFDKLPKVKQYNDPMPSSPWRKKFILKKYFGESP